MVVVVFLDWGVRGKFSSSCLGGFEERSSRRRDGRVVGELDNLNWCGVVRCLNPFTAATEDPGEERTGGQGGEG